MVRIMRVKAYLVASSKLAVAVFLTGQAYAQPLSLPQNQPRHQSQSQSITPQTIPQTQPGSPAPTQFPSPSSSQPPSQDPAAEKPPRSILFPSDAPGPYLPPEDLNRPPAEDGDVDRPRQTVGPSGEGERGRDEITVDDKIIVAELEEQDPASYGLLSPQNGGFPAHLWRGTSLETVLRFYPILPVPARSPVMQSLTHRLLFSAAAVPQREADEVAPSRIEAEMTPAEEGPEEGPEKGSESRKQNGMVNGPQSPYLKARLEKIIATGDLKQLTAFLQILPPGTIPLTRTYADILLLAGDLPLACEMTRRALETNTFGQDHLFWLKMLAYCRAVEGNMAGANLAIDMLQEEGATDYVFFDLINKLLAGAGEQTSAKAAVMSLGYAQLDPLLYSLLTTLGQGAEGEQLAQSSPLVQYAVAGNANLSAEVRLKAAHEAYQAGRFPVDSVRAIYNLQDFTDSELNSALALTEGEDTALADVLLYQAAEKQIDVREKVRILNRIWDRALQRGDLPRAAQLHQRAVKALDPSLDLVVQAPSIVRALLLSGNSARALDWYDFIRRAAFEGNAVATKALVDIWPLMLVMDEQNRIPWSTEILDLWWNGQMVLSSAARNRKAALFYSVLEALGHEVPEAVWSTLGPDLEPEDSAADVVADSAGRQLQQDMTAAPMSPAVQPRRVLHSISPVIWRRLIKSAREARLGETVMLGLIALGPDGPSSLEAISLSTIIRSLRAVGLDKEARQLALEALAGRGF